MRAKTLKSAGHLQGKVAQNRMLKSNTCNIYLFVGAQKTRMKETHFTFDLCMIHLICCTSISIS